MGTWHGKSVFLTRSLTFCVVHSLVSLLLCRDTAGSECPAPNRILFAYPDGDKLEVHYEYDPFRTNINVIDKFLTKVIDRDDVVCEWEVRAKEGHHAEVSFPVLDMQAATASKSADCLKIYDGEDEDGRMLAELCGADIPAEMYDSSDRSLFIVFTQGEREGSRSLVLHYKARPRSKAFIIKIAGIVSGVIAAVVICFLAYKFSHSCRPCRKHCCPDSAAEDGRDQRELRPLTPLTLVPPSMASCREDNLRNQELAAQHTDRRDGGGELNGTRPRVAGSENAGDGVRNSHRHGAPYALSPGEDSDSEEIQLPPADVMPPSYDSIFGEGDYSPRK